jgi:hypothetical protein
MLEVKFVSGGFLEGLGTLAKDLLPYMRTTFEAIAQFALQEVRIETPPTRTGTDLRALWNLTGSHTGAVTEFIIKNLYKDPQVIVWFEEGTPAHVIPIGPAGFLHFFTYEGDEVYTKKPVHHPGTPAWKMVEITRKMTENKLDQYAAQTYAMVDRMLGGK